MNFTAVIQLFHLMYLKYYSMDKGCALWDDFKLSNFKCIDVQMLLTEKFGQ